jgi:hypothetical protein
MPHPATLIQSILAQVRSTYSAPEYRFEVERPLFLKDRSMQPDIQVFGQDGELLCAVEIGYTRPEKLKHYRQIGIPDVRWYSKAGELVDDYMTVERRVHVIEKRLEYSGSAWHKLYFTTDDQAVMCSSAAAAVFSFCEYPSWQALRALVISAYEHDLGPDEIRSLVYGVTDPAEIRLNPTFWACDGVFFSNGAVKFAVAHCNICDHVGIAYSEAHFDQVLVSPGSGRPKYDALDCFANFLKLSDRQALEGDDTDEIVPMTEIVSHIEQKYNVRLELDQTEPAE